MSENKECFKTKIGGQAVIEGIAMRGPKKTCLAVRQPDGTIKTEMYDTKPNPVAKIPLVRGAVAMIISLLSGYKYLMRAADIAFPEEAEKAKQAKENGKKTLDDLLGPVAGLLGGLLAVALFVLLPTLITSFISRFVELGAFKSAVEGLVKMVIFIGYLAAISLMPDIRRVFEYHGAEHKTIACYEHRGELVPANVRNYSRFHPRCGTSFIFIVLIISILVGSVIPWHSTLGRMGLKLLCLPIIMGISYEIIQYAGAHDNLLSRVLSAPGLWVQRLTVFNPSDDMIEVAIASLLAVIPDNEAEAEWSAQ